MHHINIFREHEHVNMFSEHEHVDMIAMLSWEELFE